MIADAPTVARAVCALRRAPVRGHVIDLVPYRAAHHERVIALRNTERASYFLHQPAPLTREGQAGWFASYLNKTDDLQWAIVRKDGAVVGATALYGIADDRSMAEKGRLVADPLLSKQGPYVLEAELLLLDVAFARLDLRAVTTCVRDDNGVMQHINARLGFERSGQHVIRGVEYFDYRLTADRYAPEPLRATAVAWAQRTSRTQGAPR